MNNSTVIHPTAGGDHPSLADFNVARVGRFSELRMTGLLASANGPPIEDMVLTVLDGVGHTLDMLGVIGRDAEGVSNINLDEIAYYALHRLDAAKELHNRMIAAYDRRVIELETAQKRAEDAATLLDGVIAFAAGNGDVDPVVMEKLRRVREGLPHRGAKSEITKESDCGATVARGFGS